MNKNVFAFIVGIETYDQPGWNVAGPSTNALAVVDWLLSINVPACNIFLFLGPLHDLNDRIVELEREGVRATLATDWNTIDTFWRRDLRLGRPAGARLLVYWSGHGFAESNGTRIFVCRDYRDPTLQNRVFNGTNFRRHLLGPDYQCFSEQIILADVCAVHNELKSAPDRSDPAAPAETTRQTTYFATPEGQYAKGTNGRGVFTETALAVLYRINAWPEQTAFSEAMQDGFRNVGQTPFRVSGFEGYAEISDSRIGSMVADSGDSLFNSVYSLLSPFNLSDTIFLPHFLRTVADLGEPALAEAQGLNGMIRELASLRDAATPQQVPYGLIQFLVRLGQEEMLTEPIGKWLHEHAAAQGNDRANVAETIRAEKELKIVVIEVIHDDRGQVAAFHPLVRAHDLRPLPGLAFVRREVCGWDEFCEKLLTFLDQLRTEHSITDFQIQFVVDAPLFDRLFHRIQGHRGMTLGEEFVVVLRHRDRMLSPTKLVRDEWQKYADTLRHHKPADLKLLAVPAAGSAGVLPADKGLCYTNFVVQPASADGSGGTAEKKMLVKLLRLGVPYLYWLHVQKPDSCVEVERSFSGWLKELASLDEFPVAFTRERMGENQLATFATLLWDDPQFNPFCMIKGVSVK
jgi:hypothetical protein